MGYDDDDRTRRWIANIGILAVVGLLAAGGVWYFRSDGATTRQLDLTELATVPPPADDVSTTAGRTPTTTGRGTAGADPGTTGTTDDADAADAADKDDEDDDATDATDGTDEGASSAGGSTTTEVAQAGPTLPGGDTFPIPSSTEAPDGPGGSTGSTTATTTGATSTSTNPAPDLGYPTAPDGSPLPVIAIFDIETITVTGYVPSEAARERLRALAVANSKTPAEVVDNMIVDPDVPMSVGVRVLEMNSARFPEGSADILPAHAAELDRVVNIMNALPNITVLVVGHADQRGDDARNFAISDERARAVVNYLRFMGISPTRLASRAAGESDLLTLNDDDAALALNRRTEFVFYGLLAA